MDIKFNYDNFLIMDCEKFLSISHCFFLASLCKNRIMSVSIVQAVSHGQCDLLGEKRVYLFLLVAQ